MDTHIAVTAVRLLLITGSFFASSMTWDFWVRCDNRPCLNGGTCIIDEFFSACRCPEGFFGTHCQSALHYETTFSHPITTTTTTPVSFDDDDSGGFFDVNSTMTITGGVLCFVFLGLLCFLCVSKLPRSDSQEDLCDTPPIARREPNVARRSLRSFLSRDPRRDQSPPRPPAGEDNTAYARDYMADIPPPPMAELPPPYSSLEFPPAYSTVVKEQMTERNEEDCEERNVNRGEENCEERNVNENGERNVHAAVATGDDSPVIMSSIDSSEDPNHDGNQRRETENSSVSAAD